MSDIADKLSETSESITQREWLQITRALDRTREEVNEDFGLQLLAIAWAKEKHERGVADWDKFLDMTDKALLEYLGIDVDEVAAEAEEAKPAAKSKAAKGADA